MINRIEKTFEKLKADGDKALVSFITAGDPNMEKSEQILCDLPKYGVDIIEVAFLSLTQWLMDQQFKNLVIEQFLLDQTCQNLKNYK